MCDVVIALSRFGYRPPADVFDTFVRHISDHTHELDSESTLALSDALTSIVPGYLISGGGGSGGDGHSEYHELQMRLRSVEMPRRVLLRSVPLESPDISSEPTLEAGSSRPADHNGTAGLSNGHRSSGVASSTLAEASKTESNGLGKAAGSRRIAPRQPQPNGQSASQMNTQIDLSDRNGASGNPSSHRVLVQ